MQHASNLSGLAIDRGEAVPEEELRALERACEAVGDRWSLPIVASLLAGPLRYTELQERLPAIAPNILTARLRKLEGAGLVLSSRYSARPPRFDYRLTPDGAALADAVRVLSSWGGGRLGAARGPVHDACGTPLGVRWWCPTCEVPAAPEEEAPILA